MKKIYLFAFLWFIPLMCFSTTLKQNNKTLTQNEVGQMVTAYYQAHPEKLLSLLQNVQSLLKVQQFNGVKKRLLQSRAFLLQQHNLPTLGSPHAKETLLFFYDIQCAYCHAEYPIIQQWLHAHVNTRVVFVPLHIFGKASLYANQVSLYAMRIGKFKPFIERLEKANLTEGKLTMSAINHIARRVGINRKALKQAVQSDKIKKTLLNTDQLQTELGIEGTPFLFVLPTHENTIPLSAIGLHRGFANAAQLQQLMKT